MTKQKSYDIIKAQKQTRVATYRIEDIMKSLYLVKENYQDKWKIAYICEYDLQALKKALKHYLLDEEGINNFRSEADYYKGIYNLIADEKINKFYLINDILRSNLIPLCVDIVSLSDTENTEYLD